MQDTNVKDRRAFVVWFILSYVRGTHKSTTGSKAKLNADLRGTPREVALVFPPVEVAEYSVFYLEPMCFSNELTTKMFLLSCKEKGNQSEFNS